MIIEIENTAGKQLGALQVHEDEKHQNIKILKSVLHEISIADFDGDDIFNTDEEKIRIQLDY